jgi:hypothetical protein
MVARDRPTCSTWGTIVESRSFTILCRQCFLPKKGIFVAVTETSIEAPIKIFSHPTHPLLDFVYARSRTEGAHSFLPNIGWRRDVLDFGLNLRCSLVYPGVVTGTRSYFMRYSEYMQREATVRRQRCWRSLSEGCRFRHG